jgi:hypothetical protein
MPKKKVSVSLAASGVDLVVMTPTNINNVKSNY